MTLNFGATSGDRLTAGAIAVDAGAIAVDTAPDEVLRERRHNEDVAWAGFSPVAYWNHNYRYLRDDDREIIHTVGEFFANHFRTHRAPVESGIDVGSGSNLYPALAMLPWCQKIWLTDYSPSNVTWLRKHTASARGELDEPWAWQSFWNEYLEHEGYSAVSDPRKSLTEATHGNIREWSVFSLPRKQFDMGTMFFVADSMTSYENEFHVATEQFIRCLRPGSPFAAAFMDSSVGYVVDDKSFPAVQEVNPGVVQSLLKNLRADAQVSKVSVPASDPLRDGYKGMIIAVGTAVGTA
jgi:hypothetical protein